MTHPIACRPANLDDEAELHFVVDGWASSFRDADSAGLIQVEDWYDVMIPQIRKALARPDVRTFVATSSLGERGINDLIGFIVVDTEERPPLVYYVYTKGPYQRGGRGRLWEGAGAARLLFIAAGVDPRLPLRYVCKTAIVPVLARKIPLGRWHPLLGRFPKDERRNR